MSDGEICCLDKSPGEILVAILSVADARKYPGFKQGISQFDNRLENFGKRDSYIWYGPQWAQVSSSPLRGFKPFPVEGGIRVPAFIYHPKLKRNAEVDDSFITVMDVAPTLMELAGTEAPEKIYKGREVLPFKGTSMVSFLDGEEERVHSPSDAVSWELFGRKAIRQGDWKLVWSGPPFGAGNWELYNLSEDLAERHDLSAREPEKKRTLLKLWHQYQKENGLFRGTEGLRAGK